MTAWPTCDNKPPQSLRYFGVVILFPHVDGREDCNSFRNSRESQLPGLMCVPPVRVRGAHRTRSPLQTHLAHKRAVKFSCLKKKKKNSSPSHRCQPPRPTSAEHIRGSSHYFKTRREDYFVITVIHFSFVFMRLGAV